MAELGWLKNTFGVKDGMCKSSVSTWEQVTPIPHLPCLPFSSSPSFPFSSPSKLLPACNHSRAVPCIKHYLFVLLLLKEEQHRSVKCIPWLLQ